MPTPRKPQPSSATPSRRILIICAIALLLIGGWVLTQYDAQSVPEPASALVATDSLITGTIPDTASQAVAETMPALSADLVEKNPVKKVKEPEITPPANPQPVLPTAAEKPAKSVKAAELVIKPAEPVKAAPVACDQLVMRSGDLLDVKVSEIGVNEIRYKRCNWKDSPQYVVAKADVLSIHFANGDVERF